MEARLTLRRLLSLAAIAAAVATTSACGGGAPAQAAPKDPPLVEYSGKYLSFTHPAAWTATAPTGPGLGFHFQPIVYLSTQQVGSPCSLQGNTTTCGWPIKDLQRGGVLGVWQFPYTGPIEFMPQGKRITVGGYPAWVSEKPGRDCRGLGADRTIDAMIKRSPGNFIAFTACLRGPGLAQDVKSVNALLASVKFASQ
jgi:hypothetical protein